MRAAVRIDICHHKVLVRYGFTISIILLCPPFNTDNNPMTTLVILDFVNKEQPNVLLMKLRLITTVLCTDSETLRYKNIIWIYGDVFLSVVPDR